MRITLDPSLAKFITDQVKAGRYASTTDALNSAVARLQTDVELSKAGIERLRAELDPAIAEADRGEFVEFTAEDVIAERRAARGSRSRRAKGR
jgi:putative addiction module CopG family antidote